MAEKRSDWQDYKVEFSYTVSISDTFTVRAPSYGAAKEIMLNIIRRGLSEHGINPERCTVNFERVSPILEEAQNN